MRLARKHLLDDGRVSFKLRVGDYRILYTYDREKPEIVVHFVRHRREVYKVR